MSLEYDLYLHNHRENVAEAFRWIQTNLPELLIEGFNYEHQICFAHDESKTRGDEYRPYDAYFYGGNRSHKVVQEFNEAWLKHIHRNPHHWQHWILVNDDPGRGTEILDMPYNYIIEMICDWWAFSFAKGDLYEIFKWYSERNQYMQLSDKTRKTVNSILPKIHDKLKEIEDNKE